MISRLGILVICGAVGLCSAPISVQGSGGAFDSAELQTLIDAANLIVFAEVTDTNLSSLFGHVELTVISVWHEHFTVSGAWGPKRLPVMTKEELSEGQEVVAFIEYNPKTTRWFASVGVLSDSDTIASGHPTLVGKRRDDLWALVGVHEHPESVAEISAWAELIGLGEVEQLNLAGLSGLHQIRLCEVWHGHAGMDEYWDGRSIPLPIREDEHPLRREPTVGERLVVFVRYDRQACTFQSEVGILSPGNFVILGGEALVGACLDDLRAAVTEHHQTHPFSPLGIREKVRDAEAR